MEAADGRGAGEPGGHIALCPPCSLPAIRSAATCSRPPLVGYDGGRPYRAHHRVGRDVQPARWAPPISPAPTSSGACAADRDSMERR